MTERIRLRVFLVAGPLLLGLYAWAAFGLPAWGSFHGPYGEYIAHMAVHERHSTDTINAINYDYRAFDTLGEEFILFTAVLGVMLLLRRDGPPDNVPGQVPHETPLSLTVRTVAMPAAALTIIFGFYIGTHGQLTPGGGFQAGVILATAPLLIYLSEDKVAFQRIASHLAIEIIEAAAAGGYAIIGVAALFFGAPLLTNILPLGEVGSIFSSGTIALISVTVGFEVTAAFLLVAHTYLQEIIAGGLSGD